MTESPREENHRAAMNSSSLCIFSTFPHISAPSESWRLKSLLAGRSSHLVSRSNARWVQIQVFQCLIEKTKSPNTHTTFHEIKNMYLASPESFGRKAVHSDYI